MAWYDDGELRFAVGIEDTFVPQSAPGLRPLDEYDLMQHYRFWSDDLGYAKESGATMVRWGIPWYKVNPALGEWDFEWLDQVVDRFEELGLELVADLMHYGTPLWLEDEFANSEYPVLVAEFAGQVARRYRGRIAHYTPLNEPMLNIMYCGEFGHWPPALTGQEGFVTVLRGVAKGLVLTQQAVTAEDPDADFVHVEASFRFVGDSPRHAAQIEHLRQRAFLVEDLVTGSVGRDHPLVPWLRDNGFTDADFEWHRANVAWPDVMGVNYYPQHSTELFEDGVEHHGGPGDLRPRQDDWTEGLEELLRGWQARYERPVFLTETCQTGSVEDRIRWMDASVASVHRLRAEGLDVVGYTWWCVTDMFEWTYRAGDGSPMDYHLAMGLWSLEEDEAGVMQRVKNAAADRFAFHATQAHQQHLEG